MSCSLSTVSTYQCKLDTFHWPVDDDSSTISGVWALGFCGVLIVRKIILLCALLLRLYSWLFIRIVNLHFLEPYCIKYVSIVHFLIMAYMGSEFALGRRFKLVDIIFISSRIVLVHAYINRRS